MPKTALKIWRVFLILLVSFFLLSKPKLIHAAFTKYTGNPIMSGTPGGWDSNWVQGTFILKEENLYKMWYQGNNGSGWKLHYATSTDGINWNKNGIPIIWPSSWDGWEMDNGDPYVIHDETGYKMWYSSLGHIWQSGPDRFRLRYATSSDGINWTKVDKWLLTGTNGSWDSGGMNRGITVLKIGNIYKMWFAAVNEGYSGSYQEMWKIGYATSNDGINWIKYPNPVIEQTEQWEQRQVSYPHVVYDGQYYHMWYASTYLNLPTNFVYARSVDGINWEKPGSINPILSIGTLFDSTFISTPFTVKVDSLIRLYYSGYDGNQWRIGMAEGTLDLPTPTPTPGKDYVVILPGLGASWNHIYMLTGQEQPQSQWKMTPGINVYSGLIQTLENAGYVLNQDLFVFNYNWTKRIGSMVDDLESYVNQTVHPPPGTKIDLVGHSLGGMVARAYLQKYGGNSLDQVVSIGSPHQGAPKVYYLWEGGDLQKLDAWQRIPAGLLLHLRKFGFSTTKEAIHSIVPVIGDLLPTFNYLKKNSQEIPVENMILKNNWLISLNNNIPNQVIEKLKPMRGVSYPTLSWVSVVDCDWTDQILNLWPDGKPTGNIENDSGDYTVLAKSATLNNIQTYDITNTDHRDLVETQIGQEEIMRVLGLTPTDYDLRPKLNYNQALVFQIASPATVTIIKPDGTPLSSGEDLLIIPDAQVGEYNIEIGGTGNGLFTLYSGQITESGDIWSQITASIYNGEIKDYKFDFYPDNPLLEPIGINHPQTLDILINNLAIYLNNQNFPKNIKQSLFRYLDNIDEDLKDKAYNQTIIELYEIRIKISFYDKHQKIDHNVAINLKNQIAEITNHLEIIYLDNVSGEYPTKRLVMETKIAERLFERFEREIKRKRSTYPDIGVLYLTAQEKFDKIKSSISFESHLNALGARYLSEEGILLL